MEKYDYHEQIKNDILDHIKSEYPEIMTSDFWDCTTKDMVYDTLYDKLWLCDNVTGNASGSYTFSTWQAEENLCHNTDLLKEAVEEFGGKIPEGAEAQDVTIRCYLLSECLNEVLDEIEEEVC